VRRFVLGVTLFVAVNGLLAAVPVVMGALKRNMYLGAALILSGEIALYAAVLVIMRIRRSRAIMEGKR